MSDWIRFSDLDPEIGEAILVYFPKSDLLLYGGPLTMTVEFRGRHRVDNQFMFDPHGFSGPEWDFDFLSRSDLATHWMRLPDPPTGGNIES